MRLPLLALLTLAALSAQPPAHKVVYEKEGRFAGWPANHGMWSWGNEMVVGFDAGVWEFHEKGHAINRNFPPQ